jgi:hypothetical protein
MSERLNGHVPFYSWALPPKFSSKETQFSWVGGGSQKICLQAYVKTVQRIFLPTNLEY